MKSTKNSSKWKSSPGVEGILIKRLRVGSSLTFIIRSETLRSEFLRVAYSNGEQPLVLSFEKSLHLLRKAESETYHLPILNVNCGRKDKQLFDRQHVILSMNRQLNHKMSLCNKPEQFIGTCSRLLGHSGRFFLHQGSRAPFVMKKKKHYKQHERNSEPTNLKKLLQSITTRLMKELESQWQCTCTQIQ